MKNIRLSQHAKQQCVYRGTNEDEICETIRTSKWIIGELGRYECKKDFIFKNVWNGKFYKIKQVRPIFVEEENEIIVITVYVYYF
jgi:hypothetical protein